MTSLENSTNGNKILNKISAENYDKMKNNILKVPVIFDKIFESFNLDQNLRDKESNIEPIS